MIRLAAGVVVVVVLAAACSSDSFDAEKKKVSDRPAVGATAPTVSRAPDPSAVAAAIRLPSGAADEIVFYYGLPTDDEKLRAVAKAVSTPGTASYRHFLPYDDAAREYGASAEDIQTALRDVAKKGLHATVDPSRVFVRVSGTAAEWQTALGKPLKIQKATNDVPFDFYDFNGVPSFGPKLRHVDAGATVYDTGADGARGGGASANDLPSSSSAADWPVNGGADYGHVSCATKDFVRNNVFTPEQIAQAYGTAALRDGVDPADARVAVVDLGGGFSTDDITGAARCFGYARPKIEVQHGDGVGHAIRNNNDETALDIQTMAAVVPGATIEVVQTANGPASVLDAVSRTFGDKSGPPEAASISYGQCALDEASSPELIKNITRVLGIGLLAGSAVFVSAGDSGSTTCGADKKGPTQSFAASSPWVTAVGGTRLSLTTGNTRADEVVWNDTPFGTKAASGGGLSRVFDSPWYQQDLGLHQRFGNHRAVPDLAALAAISPGWPVVVDGDLEAIGGTSGASPFVAANIGLLAQRERAAGRPPLGFVNPWLYQTFTKHPDAFYDVVAGSNDIQSAGCCTAGPGYDLATGLGVPNWTILERLIEPAG